MSSKFTLAKPDELLLDTEYEIGVDVSVHNGDINWKQVAAYKRGAVRFAFIKATEGATLTDKQVRRNTLHAYEQNIRIGFYHFAYPQPHKFNPQKEGESEAAHFCNVVTPLIKSLHLNHNEILPFVLDFEHADFLTMPKEDVYAWVKAWCDKVYEQFGDDARILIYTNQNHGRVLTYQDLIDYIREKNIELWQAHYTGSATNGKINLHHVVNGFLPKPPTAWEEATYFQYTQAGLIPGIGQCDININLLDDSLDKHEEERLTVKKEPSNVVDLPVVHRSNNRFVDEDPKNIELSDILMTIDHQLTLVQRLVLQAVDSLLPDSGEDEDDDYDEKAEREYDMLVPSPDPDIILDNVTSIVAKQEKEKEREREKKYTVSKPTVPQPITVTPVPTVDDSDRVSVEWDYEISLKQTMDYCLSAQYIPGGFHTTDYKLWYYGRGEKLFSDELLAAIRNKVNATWNTGRGSEENRREARKVLAQANSYYAHMLEKHVNSGPLPTPLPRRVDKIDPNNLSSLAYAPTKSDAERERLAWAQTVLANLFRPIIPTGVWDENTYEELKLFAEELGGWPGDNYGLSAQHVEAFKVISRAWDRDITNLHTLLTFAGTAVSKMERYRYDREPSERLDSWGKGGASTPAIRFLTIKR